jgi:hypothetical protein
VKYSAAQIPSSPETLLIAIIEADLAVIRERARTSISPRINDADVDPSLTGPARKRAIHKSSACLVPGKIRRINYG